MPFRHFRFASGSHLGNDITHLERRYGTKTLSNEILAGMEKELPSPSLYRILGDDTIMSSETYGLAVRNKRIDMFKTVLRSYDWLNSLPGFLFLERACNDCKEIIDWVARVGFRITHFNYGSLYRATPKTMNIVLKFTDMTPEEILATPDLSTSESVKEYLTELSLERSMNAFNSIAAE